MIITQNPNSNSLFKKGFLLGSNNSSSKGGIASGGSSASQQQRPEAVAASSPAGARTPSQHNDPSSQSSSSTDTRGNATIAGGMEIIKPKAPEQRAGVVCAKYLMPLSIMNKQVNRSNNLRKTFISFQIH